MRTLKTQIRGFVRCDPQAELADGSLSTVCYVDGASIMDPPVDLGAWLIEQGLAVCWAGRAVRVSDAGAHRPGQPTWRVGFPVDQIIR